MKKKLYITRAVKLVALALALISMVFVLQGTLLRRIDQNALRMDGFYLEDKGSLDAVLIGASDVYAGYSAPYAYDKYGLTSYPYATQSTPSDVVLSQIKEVIKDQDPKVIIVEINPFLYTASKQPDEVNRHLFADNIPRDEIWNDYIKENIYSGESNLNMFCVLIFLLLLPRILKIIFIFPFYKVNYRFKVFLFGSVVNLLLVNIPLMFELVYNTDYAFIILNILLVFGCDIINISCSCYLSFIMQPDWNFLCLGVGHWINYSIIIGKILGGIISFIFSVDNHINHWIWMGITIAFFIYIFVLIFFTRIIRIKGIVRIIRKNAIEANE